MHVVNIMFSKNLGGIEQAFIDYTEALQLAGHKVTAIIYPRAKIKEQLLKLKTNIIEVKNFSAHDIFAKKYLKKILQQLQPNAVIVHGNRALLLTTGQTTAPVIGVTHNYSIKYLTKLDLVLATTDDLALKLKEQGIKAEKIFLLPNMVRVPKIESGQDNAAPRNKLVIGTMGRMVKKKGFAVFIDAIKHLKSIYNNEIGVLIGGEGEELKSLQDLSISYGLSSRIADKNDVIKFIGWVKNKTEFFNNIDIFCLPSLHEPFGIILLEAYAYKKPVITTDAEGPSFIAQNLEDALVVKKNDSTSMALAIKQLLDDANLRTSLAEKAYLKAKTYDIENFSSKLDQALLRLI